MKIMEGNYLLPHSWRKYGWVMLAITIALSIVILLSGYEIRWPNTTVFAIYDDELMGKDVWFSFIQTEIGDELVSIGLIISALIVAFTKEKIGDELAVIIFVVTCLANQMDIDLTKAIKTNFDKKTNRDADRHINNDKL